MQKNTITAISVAVAAIGLMFSVSVAAEKISTPQYKANLARINAEYVADKDSCRPLAGNAKKVCMVQAKAKEKVAKAELEAARKNTRKAQYDAQIVKVNADYWVAKEKCNGRAGNAKDVCLKEAKVAEGAAKFHVESQMNIFNANQKANKLTINTRRDSGDISYLSAYAVREIDPEKRQAEYAAAKEKCEALIDNYKQDCLNETKVRYKM